MSTKGKMLGYVTAIFLAGMFIGGILGVSYAKRELNDFPRESQIAQSIRAHLEGRAGIAPEQIRKIDPIIEDTAARLEALHRDMTRQVRNLFIDFHKQIATPAGLTEQQKQRLVQMEIEHQERDDRAAGTPSTPHTP